MRRGGNDGMGTSLPLSDEESWRAERTACDRARTTAATVRMTRPTSSSTRATDDPAMCSWNNPRPTSTPASGSTTLSVGSEATSGPAWNALCTTRTTSAVVATKAYGDHDVSVWGTPWRRAATDCLARAADPAVRTPPTNARVAARRAGEEARPATTIPAAVIAATIAANDSHADAEAVVRPRLGAAATRNSETPATRTSAAVTSRRLTGLRAGAPSGATAA